MKKPTRKKSPQGDLISLLLAVEISEKLPNRKPFDSEVGRIIGKLNDNERRIFILISETADKINGLKKDVDEILSRSRPEKFNSHEEEKSPDQVKCAALMAEIETLRIQINTLRQLLRGMIEIDYPEARKDDIDVSEDGEIILLKYEQTDDDLRRWLFGQLGISVIELRRAQ